jgi:hypothetical protein
MATLSVQEAMGFKVDREAVATLVLPQLWAMSMGPRKSTKFPTLSIIKPRFHSVEPGSVSTFHVGYQKAGRKSAARA